MVDQQLTQRANSPTDPPHTGLTVLRRLSRRTDRVGRPKEAAHPLCFGVGVFEGPVLQCQERTDQPLCGKGIGSAQPDHLDSEAVDGTPPSCRSAVQTAASYSSVQSTNDRTSTR